MDKITRDFYLMLIKRGAIGAFGTLGLYFFCICIIGDANSANWLEVVIDVAMVIFSIMIMIESRGKFWNELFEINIRRQKNIDNEVDKLHRR